MGRASARPIARARHAAMTAAAEAAGPAAHVKSAQTATVLARAITANVKPAMPPPAPVLISAHLVKPAMAAAPVFVLVTRPPSTAQMGSASTGPGDVLAAAVAASVSSPARRL